MTEIVASPGDSTPLRMHAKEDEYILALEGTARLQFGEEQLEAEAGK